MDIDPSQEDIHDLKNITEALVSLLNEELDHEKQAYFQAKSTLNTLHHELFHKKSYLNFLQNSISRSDQPILDELQTLSSKIKSSKIHLKYLQSLIETQTLKSPPVTLNHSKYSLAQPLTKKTPK